MLISESNFKCMLYSYPDNQSSIQAADCRICVLNVRECGAFIFTKNWIREFLMER